MTRLHRKFMVGMLTVLLIPVLLLDNSPSYGQSETLPDIIQASDIRVPEPPGDLERIQFDNVGDIRLLAVLPRFACLTYFMCPVSNDGRRLMLREHRSSTVASYDMTDFTITNQIEVPRDSGAYVSSYTGRFLVYSADGQLYIHDVNIGNTQTILVEGTGRVVTFTPDDSTLVIRTNTEIVVVDPISAQRRFVYPSATNLRVTINNELLVIYPWDSGEMRVYQLTDGALVKVVNKDARFHGVLIDSRSRWLASSWGDVIVYWSLMEENPDERQFVVPEQVFALRFSPIEDLLLTQSHEQLQVWHLSNGTLLASYPLNHSDLYNINPDGRFVVTTSPLRIIDLVTMQVSVIEGYYDGETAMFDPTGSTLVVSAPTNIMVFGIPSATRPPWQPVTARVVPSGINVRAQPNLGAEVIGIASGEVVVSARSRGQQAVYLPDYDGWVWTNPAYLDIDEAVLDILPWRFIGDIP